MSGKGIWWYLFALSFRSAAFATYLNCFCWHIIDHVTFADMLLIPQLIQQRTPQGPFLILDPDNADLVGYALTATN